MLFVASTVDQKGQDMGVTKLVSEFIKNWGPVKFVNRSCREHATLNMMESAVAMSGPDFQNDSPTEDGEATNIESGEATSTDD